MNALSVSFVLVRLAAVFLFVRGVQGLSSFSYLLAGNTPAATFAGITLVFGVILPTGIAFVLWLQPEKVTGAQASTAGADQPLNAQQILTIGIALLGLYLLVYGIVDLFRIEAAQLLQSQMISAANLPNEVFDTQVVINRIMYSVQLILGLALVLGRQSLSALLMKARYVGVVDGRGQPSDQSARKSAGSTAVPLR